jgi:PAP2 superfamily
LYFTGNSIKKSILNLIMKKTPNRHIVQKAARLVSCLVLLAAYSCKTNDDQVKPVETDKSPAASTLSAEVATKWADMDLFLIRKSAGFSPPVAARALGYAGLTFYEAVVPGIKTNKSLAGQLNGLKTLPKIDSSKTYHWGASANAAAAYIAANIWDNAPDAAKKTADSLRVALRAGYVKETSEDIVKASEAYGVSVAKAIFDWSMTDGGHQGYLRNYPTDYQVPIFQGAWQPTENGRKIPLQPYWGRNRTMVGLNGIIPAPAPLVISTNETSSYFKEYNAVYIKYKSLTQAEKEISVWWADDPSETFTPPGHSYNLAKIAVKTSMVKLDKAAEAFARTGIAVNDAFIMCWKCKYTFNNERPYTFVRRAIDPNWVPFWPAPPFPGYISGHASQSAATASVLAVVFGDNFAFTDDSHVGRVKDTKRNVEFKARSYKSFTEAATESALSRFLGGIHTMQDNNVGLVEGKKVANNINDLKWKN